MDEYTENGAEFERELFLLDSNVFDKLAAEPDAFIRHLRRAVIDIGRMRLLNHACTG